MNYVKTAFIYVSMIFILLASMLVFLVTTTPGLYTSIKLANLFVPGKILIKKGTGRLIDHFSFAELAYINDGVSLQLIEGNINWQLKTILHHQLTISNSTVDKLLVSQTTHKTRHDDGSTRPFSFQLHINQLTINKVQIGDNGAFQHFNTIKLNASLNDNRWIVHSPQTTIANQRFLLEANGEMNAPYALLATVQFSPLPGKPGLKGHINVNGDLNLYQWQGQFNGPVQGSLHGTLKNGFYIDTEASWHDAKWPINQTSALHSSQGILTISGNLQDTLLNTDMHIEAPIKAKWQITARIKNKKIDVKSVLTLLQNELKTSLLVNATLNGANDAKLALIINPGVYQLPQKSPIPAIPFKGGRLLITLTPKALLAKGMFTIDQQTTLNLGLRMPSFHFNDIKHQALDGTLNINVNSLGFLKGLSPLIEKPQGQLQMKLTTKGTLGTPIITGALILSNASVFLPKTGLSFSPINARLQTKNNQWQAEGSINSNGQSLNLKGQGKFSPLITGQLHLLGENFLAMKTPQYTIDLSPQLTIDFNPMSLSVSGSILVPTATLKPTSFSNTVNLSEDVVFVHEKSSIPDSPFNLSTDLQINMGQKVELEVKGLDGFLDGSLHIKKLPHAAVNAIGELTIRDGKYRAYGQDLIVVQGQLLFAGGAIDNPGIRLQAIRKFNSTSSTTTSPNHLFDFNAANLDSVDLGQDITVGININGRLNAHTIKLFSIPATLSQSDILSMLLLGRPASQASKSGGQLLLAAISSMNLDTGKKGMQLLSQLKQTLGIDLNVQNNTLYNQQTNQASDNTALVVGKSLSKRIYLSYNIGLLQKDSNVLTLKYLLNKFFSIQVSTSDSANGIDFLYTRGEN